MLHVVVFLTPLLLLFLFATIKMLPQYQRGVVFRLGKVKVPKGPGVVVVIPLLKRFTRVDMRTITHDVPEQDIISKANVSVRLGAVLSLPGWCFRQKPMLLSVPMDLLKGFMFKDH